MSSTFCYTVKRTTMFAIRVDNYLRNKISRQMLETKIRNQDLKNITSAAEREH